MTQRKELVVAPGGRHRATKALPVDTDGTIHLDSPAPGNGRQESERTTADPDERARHDSWAGAAQEDIIDNKIAGETGPEPDAFDAEKEKLRDRARSFFGGWSKDRANAYHHRRTTRTQQAAGDDEGLSEREQLLTLREEIARAGEQYMDSLRESKLFVPGFFEAAEKEQDRKLDAMHQVYVQMMMQGCIRPLSRGINATSVIQVVGMMTALTLLSKDFRHQFGEYAQPVKDKLRERIDNKTISRRSWAEHQSAMRNRLIDAGTEARLKRDPLLAGDEGFSARREAKKTDRNDFLSRQWQRRMDEMEHRERGNRAMYTPESAAMTEVALMENAFWRMRDPATDTNEVHASYRAMRSRLHQQMSDDGLDRTDVVQRARIIIGERMVHEPELKLMYNGLAQGRFVKASAHEERIAGSDKVRTVWRGDFVDQRGVPLPDGAMFTLRKPMNADEHQVHLAKAMRIPINDALTRRDRQTLNGQMFGYLVGFAARQRGFDASQVPQYLRRPLEQTELMLAGMDIDGLSPEKQRETYSNAFGDTMESLIEQDPDFEHDLRLGLGEDWLKRLRAATDDPEQFLFEKAIRPQPFRAGPGASPRQKSGRQCPTEQPPAEDPQPA